MTKNEHTQYYDAFLKSDPAYEGLFFAAIKTTGIFCRPTCKARKPKIENCDFFKTAQDALLAGYRPCKKCHPTNLPEQESALIKTLIAAIEANPEKRWKDADFRELGADSSTIRRHFKKRFGMTFVAYARARRMGLALKNIRSGEKIINAQIDTGYESASGFHDAFSRIMGAPPSNKETMILHAEWIDTLLGPMIVIANDDALYLLEFTDRRGLEREIERMRKKLNTAIIPGHTKITNMIKSELGQYFSGRLKTFKTPIALLGTDFQKSVWETLKTIPYGETWSYADLAKAHGNPNAFRAVARANGTNQLPLIIPCHRVINRSGELGGYSGGLSRKQWLLNLEQKHK